MMHIVPCCAGWPSALPSAPLRRGLQGTAAAVASPSKQKTYVPLTPKAEPQSPKADGAAEAEPAPPAAGSP